MFKVQPFDVLAGASGPTEAFGSLLGTAQAQAATVALGSLFERAYSRVEESFQEVVDPSESGIVKLDKIIEGMWQTGWSPESGNFNLFCTDFGALYARAFLGIDNLVPVFRSATILDHMSFWHTNSHQEFFPFHKVAKALSSAEGESLSQMLEAAVQGHVAS
jgi:hypothetical protein